jgi:signal transduction histidine kinase
MAAVGFAHGQVLVVVAAIAVVTLLVRVRLLSARRDATINELHDRFVSERHERERLIRSARLDAARELAAGIAHEVNNPLTAVLGYTDLMLVELAIDAAQRPDLELIRSEADRAARIVRSLVDFARPRPPRLAPVQLGETVRACVELVRSDAGRNDVRIRESYAKSPAQLLDPAAIQDVVLALLANALGAMPNGGSLTVTVECDRGEAYVRVADNGCGMDRDTRERAFLPYFSRAGRRGLGLSIALGIAEAHGGTIALSPVETGGTIAELRLPIVTELIAAPAPG